MGPAQSQHCSYCTGSQHSQRVAGINALCVNKGKVIKMYSGSRSRAVLALLYQSMSLSEEGYVRGLNSGNYLAKVFLKMVFLGIKKMHLLVPIFKRCTLF